MAPECFGELCWLSVTNTAGYLSHRKALFVEVIRGSGHPDIGQVVPESGLTHFRERSLQLPAGRCNPAGNVVKLEVLAVLGVD